MRIRPGDGILVIEEKQKPDNMSKLFMMGLTACGACGSSDKNEVPAASQEHAYTRVNCQITLKDLSDREKLIALGKEIVEATQSDEGMIKYDMLESITNPGKFIIFETWKDRVVLAKHMEEPHFIKIIPMIQEIAEVSIEVFDQLVDPVDNGNGFRLNISFVIDPKDKEVIKTHAIPLVEGSVKEEQCTGYDYYYSLAKEDEGLLFEDWPSQAALDFHMSTPHFLDHYPTEIMARYKSCTIDRIYK